MSGVEVSVGSRPGVEVTVSRPDIEVSPDAGEDVIITPDSSDVNIDFGQGSQGPPGPPGPQGEKGEQGGPGPGAGTLAFPQATPSDIWVIVHALGYWPNVTIVNSAGDTVEGDVEYTNADTVTVRFTGAFSGTAYLS